MRVLRGAIDDDGRPCGVQIGYEARISVVTRPNRPDEEGVGTRGASGEKLHERIVWEHRQRILRPAPRGDVAQEILQHLPFMLPEPDRAGGRRDRSVIRPSESLREHRRADECGEYANGSQPESRAPHPGTEAPDAAVEQQGRYDERRVVQRREVIPVPRWVEGGERPRGHDHESHRALSPKPFRFLRCARAPLPGSQQRPARKDREREVVAGLDRDVPERRVPIGGAPHDRFEVQAAQDGGSVLAEQRPQRVVLREERQQARHA